MGTLYQSDARLLIYPRRCRWPHPAPRYYNATMTEHQQQDPGDHAAALHEEAITLREAGSFARAEALCREAVSLFEACEGEDSPNLANALIEHGRLLEALDRFAEAAPAVDRALAILRPLVPTSPAGAAGTDIQGGPVPAEHGHKSTADEASVGDELARLLIQAEALRASVFRAGGALDEAEAGCRRALALAEAHLPSDDGLLADVLNGLGVVHKFQGRYAEAEPLYRRALKIAEAMGNDAAMATLFHNLGGLAHARGDFATGEPLARRSVELREALLGSDHPVTAADRAAWGALLEGLGRLTDAERAYAEALAVFEQRLGPRSLEASSALTALAAVQHARGATTAAEQSYRRSLDIRRALLGPRHFDLGLTMNNLAMLLVDRGEQVEALSLLQQAREILVAELGPDHPHAQAVTDNVAALTPGASKPPAGPKN